MKLSTVTGTGLIALGIGLNVPFAILGATFHYPDILREPTAIVLTQFHAGSAPLIGLLSFATPMGFVGLSVWLVATGVSFVRQRRVPVGSAPTEIAAVSVASSV